MAEQTEGGRSQMSPKRLKQVLTEPTTARVEQVDDRRSLKCLIKKASFGKFR